MTRAFPSFTRAVLGIAILASLCAAGIPARADVLLPNERGVNYCFSLANINEYSDDVFLVDLPPVGRPERIVQGDCVSGYKLSQPRFYAIRADAFDAAVFAAAAHDRTATQRYFASTPGMIRSPLTFSFLSTVSKDDPRTAVVDVFRIVRITADTLDIAPDSVRYTLENGTTETLPYNVLDQRPPPSGAQPAPVATTVTRPTAVATGAQGVPVPTTIAVATPATTGALNGGISSPPVWPFLIIPLVALLGIAVLVARGIRSRSVRRVVPRER